MKYGLGDMYYLCNNNVKCPVYIEDIDSEHVYLNEFDKMGVSYVSPDYVIELPVKRGKLQKMKASDLRILRDKKDE